MILKGKVCIDLHNHNSGFTERIDGENAITSALSDYVKYCIVSNTLANNPLQPISIRTLGGLCLINENFSGNGDICIPKTSQYIGGGSYNYTDTNSKYIGSYNQLDSGWNESTRTFKHVYDFSTSQANGDIGGIALTTDIGGRHTYIPKLPHGIHFSNYAFKLTSGYHIVYIDLENEYVYYVKGTSDVEPLYKITYSFTGFTLNQSGESINSSEEIDTGKVIDASGMLNGLWRDSQDGNIYFPYVRENAVHIRVMDTDTFTEGEEEVYQFPTQVHSKIAVTSNYIYAISWTKEYIYRYNKSNDNVGTYTVASIFGDEYKVQDIRELPEGGIYGELQSNIGETFYFRLSESNTIDFEPISEINLPNDTFIYPLDGVLGYTNYDPNYVDIIATALMTNYNPPSIITKTSSQSMRITYSIKQV